jgi:feruloyl esterase
MRSVAAFVGVVLFAVPAYAQDASASATACERLATSLGRSAAADRPASAGLSGRDATRLPQTTVTSAQPVAAGRFVPPDGGAAARQAMATLPAFCRVALTIKPSHDSDIKSEVWLPMSGWNGKFLAVGNGAWGGSIQYAALADGLRRGYAVASTDTGHTGTDASFAVGHPEKLIDFGYRAVHETAVQGKATTKALYAAAPRLSYFNGCSGGGRQSFMEAQRFPEDFDGIIAGAPGYNRTDVAFQTIGMAQATHLDADSFIPASKYPLIHRTAVNACDTLDGLKDGLITDPTRCQFDPGVLECKGGDGPGCLTMPQVVAARKIYATVIDPKTGQEVSTGLERGSELHWGSVAGDRPHDMYHDLLKFIVFKDATWDYRTLDVRKHLELARKADNGVLAATSTDLKPFVSRGNKLLIYHGWEDQNIPPRSSVNYYSQLLETMGKEQADGAVRLYMVPGMGHCGGGDGPSEFDILAALDEWREHGRAPGAILASKVEDGRVTRTRPLCPYPQIARYRGTGSIDQAENFACTAP